jgi:hypothetical protein
MPLRRVVGAQNSLCWIAPRGVSQVRKLMKRNTTGVVHSRDHLGGAPTLTNGQTPLLRQYPRQEPRSSQCRDNSRGSGRLLSHLGLQLPHLVPAHFLDEILPVLGDGQRPLHAHSVRSRHANTGRAAALDPAGLRDLGVARQTADKALSVLRWEGLVRMAADRAGPSSKSHDNPISYCGRMFGPHANPTGGSYVAVIFRVVWSISVLLFGRK